MIEFNNLLDIPFTDIDTAWLKNYEVWLRKRGLADNSIRVRFRSLRAIYNKAIECNIVKQEYYPFKAFKVSKLHEDTIKRAINKSDIEKVISYQASNEYSRLAIDMFYFPYLCAGINFKGIHSQRQLLFLTEFQLKQYPKCYGIEVFAQHRFMLKSQI